MQNTTLRRAVSPVTYFLSSLLWLLCLVLSARAQALPSGWSGADICTTAGTTTGGQTYDSTTKTYTITAAALSMQTGLGLTDDLHFTYRSVTGDYELAARLVSVTGGLGGSQVGMIMRSGTATGDPHGAAFYCPAYGSPPAKVLWTHTRGPVIDTNPYYYNIQGDTNSYRPSLNPPFWIKLVRIGNNYGAYWSLDGRDWVSFAGTSGGAFFSTSSYKIGFFLTSGSSSTTATATFDNVYYGLPRLKYKTSWVGATSAGMAAGNPSNQIFSMWVKPDGTCYTNSNWDEGGQGAKVYKDGAVLHGFMGTPAGNAWEGSVTGNASNIFFYTSRTGPTVYYGDFTTYESPWGSLSPKLTFSGTLGEVRGMAASASRIFVSDYANGVVRIVDASTHAEISQFPLARCGPIAYDGTNFWIIQAATQDTGSSALSFHTVGTYTPVIRCFQPDGTEVTPSRTITWSDGGIPTALAYQDLNNDGISADDVLWVCDNGPHQYIRKYNNLTGTPTAMTPFGQDGGIWNGSNPGQINDPAAGTDQRFYGPVGVGTDSGGNIYVACNGASIFVTDVRKFNAAGALQWRVNGLVFVNSAEFDPASDGQQIYTPAKHLTMNYTNTAPGSEWSYTGYTCDIRQNANEARNHVSPSYLNPAGVRLARLGPSSKLYMYLSGQGEVGKSWLYYFNSETAVPYGTNGGDGTAPNYHRIWTDKNLNGMVETGEYTEAPWAPGGGTLRSFDVDSGGDIWMDLEGAIRRVIYQGTQTLDNGTVVPKYDLSLGNPAGYMDYLPPAPLTYVYSTNYDKTNDILYAVGKKSDGTWALARCDKWIANPETRYNPTSTWCENLPPQTDLTILCPPPAEFNYAGLDVAGTKIFVAETYGPVHVYDTAAGNQVLQLVPGPEISTRFGWLDMSTGLNAFMRSTGEYLVTIEDAGWNASNILYRWTPAADTAVSLAPTTLTATATGRKILLTWAGPMGAITSYKVYRSTSTGTETLYQSGLTSPTFTDLNVTAGTTYYYQVVAVNAAGTSAKSNEASATPLSCGVEFVKTDTTTQGSWKTVYGNEGYEICNHATSYPGYATVTTTPSPTYLGTWAASTSDVRALQKPASGTDRIAAYRSKDGIYADPFSWTIDVGTGWHQVALYLLDWDGDRSTHQVTVYDGNTTPGTVLDYRRIGNFTMGKYLVWNVTGKVRIEISEWGPQDTTVASGLFFDPVATPNPALGWWKLDDTSGAIATDSSGAGNNAGLNAGTWTAGAHTGFNGCLTFGGTNTTSNLAYWSFNPAALPKLTYSTWFKTATTTSGVILGMWNSGATIFDPILYVGTDHKLHGAFYTGVIQNMKSAASVNDNVWHLATLTSDGQTQTLYLDGAPCGMLTAPVPAADTSGSFVYFQGGQGYANGWPNITATAGTLIYFNGLVDDARLYDRVLTTPEIWKLKN